MTGDDRPNRLRFDLSLYDVTSPQIEPLRACFDIRRAGIDLVDTALWRADPDDVRAIEGDDPMMIALVGGQVRAKVMRKLRKERREIYTDIAGRLGGHLCDILERAEGWKDAPKEC